MEPERKVDSPERLIEEYLFDLESELEEVRRNAVQWLARLGDLRAVGPLGKLTNDPSVSIRFFARKAIAAIEKRTGPQAARAPVRLPVAAAPEEGEAQLAEWRQRLSTADMPQRLRAVLDTYTAGLPQLLPILTQMLETEPEAMVRSALVSAVGRFRDPVSLPLLYRQLDDPDSRVRANTVDALARYTDPGVVEQLARLAEDPDNRVQANLARALGQLDPDFLHDQVTAMLASGSPGLRESALYVLWAVRDDWCKAELDLLVNNASEDPDFRERARQFPAGLARLSRPMQLPSAAALAAPPEPSPAYEQGFQLPAEMASPPEPEPESDPEALTRTMPGGMSEPTAPLDVAALLSRLNDRSADVKLSALGKVAGQVDERVWEQVELLAVEKNDLIRTAARKLIQEKMGDGAMADLSSAALSPRQTIDLSTGAMVLSKGAGASRAVAADSLDITALDDSISARTRTSRRPARPTVRITEPVKPAGLGGRDVPIWLKFGAPVLVFLLSFFLLVRLGGSPGASPAAPAAGQIEGDTSTGPKIAQVAVAKDLTRFIGVALPFSGKILEARDREGRYIVQAAHGNVAVQFVRPVSKPPAVGDAVDVDGVLLGKTREGYLLLRGRKIAVSQ